MDKPIVTVSNSVDTLTHFLGQRLFLQKGDPFVKKFVFLPDLHLKTSLITSFFSSQNGDVVLGIDFVELSSGLQTLLKYVTDQQPFFPPLHLLTLQIEGLIDKIGLAPQLAIEFLKYGKYGNAFLKQWSNDWQKKLWDQLFSKWNYLYQILEMPLTPPDQKLEVHLFNFPFLPKLYHLFFDKLTCYFPVYYYQFSPCLEFWSDTVTEFEKTVFLKQDDKLAQYYDQGHQLLANLGKMGRKTFRIFEEEDFILDEHYVDPTSSSYLASLQHGILHFNQTQPNKDPSVLLLPASTKLREIEILYTKLLQLNVKPSDIQVFAPDISLYAPLIEFVFNEEESPFDYTIYDLSTPSAFQAFLDLLSLDRFEVATVLKLFSNPHFAPFSDQETKRFQSWIRHSGVKWGVDAAHRKDLLPNILDQTENGTWNSAFDRLLKNLIFIPSNCTDWDLPYLDFSDAHILGKGIFLVQSLRQDLDFIKSAQLTGKKWGSHLLTLFQRYFQVKQDVLSSFEATISSLKELTGSFSFPSIKRYLFNCLQQKSGMRTTNNLESLTFRSLHSGVIQSSKIIALLGMDEGSYPRSYIPSSLNLLGTKGDYYPSPPDEDRYLLLQILMSAQNQLLISYQNINEDDGKEQAPSSLVQELDPEVEIQPPFPFDATYFSSPNPYPSRYYKNAQSYYYDKKKSLPFIPEYHTYQPLPLAEVKKDVSLNHLERFAKHPIRFYCNEMLHLYVDSHQNEEEEFFLSPLQEYRLLQQKNGLAIASQEGLLPLGRFKEIAEKKINQKREGILSIETYSLPLKKLQGSIDITKEGFPFLGKSTLHDLIKIYPLYLAVCSEQPMPLLLLQEGGKRLQLKTDPQLALHDYLQYYFIALQTPSPLISHLAQPLLKQDVHALDAKIKAMHTDPYTKHLFASTTTYDPQVIFDTWTPLLRKTFKPLLEIIA